LITDLYSILSGFRFIFKDCTFSYTFVQLIISLAALYYKRMYEYMYAWCMCIFMCVCVCVLTFVYIVLYIFLKIAISLFRKYSFCLYSHFHYLAKSTQFWWYARQL